VQPPDTPFLGRGPLSSGRIGIMSMSLVSFSGSASLVVGALWS